MLVIEFMYAPDVYGLLGDERELPVVIKAKALDSETYNIVNKMAQGCGLQVAGLFENFKSEVGFK